MGLPNSEPQLTNPYGTCPACTVSPESGDAGCTEPATCHDLRDAHDACERAWRQHADSLREQLAERDKRVAELEGERDAMRLIGGQLANVAYNLCQRDALVLSAREREVLTEVRVRWDYAVRVTTPTSEGEHE